MFQLNHDNSGANKLVAEGEYECVIVKAGNSVSRGGTEHITVRLAVRNDVEQKHQNKYIFHDIWKVKATGDYNYKNFNAIGAAAGLENGKMYNSLDDFFAELEAKPVKVTVRHDTYNGYTSAKVVLFERTAHPDLRHGAADVKSSTGGNTAGTPKMEILDEDDDLPF